jgi:hypothetical protein
VEAALKELLLSRINRPYLTAKTLFACVVLICVATVSAFAQDVSPGTWFLHNQEVIVANLPLLTAPSAEASAVLATALETILPDRDVCCGKDSGLEDAVLSAPSSLKELSAKLQGRHVLGDGLSIVVRAEYFPKSSIDPSLTIQTLMNQQPMLLKWKSHIYVLYGATYDETRTYNWEARQFVIHKLWLLDPRYSGQRRETELNAETDDWTKIQGILTLSVVRK